MKGTDQLKDILYNHHKAVCDTRPYWFNLSDEVVKTIDIITSEETKNKRIVKLKDVAAMCDYSCGKFNNVYDKTMCLLHDWVCTCIIIVKNINFLNFQAETSA